LKVFRYIEEKDTPAAYGLAADEYLMEYHSGPADYPATLRLYNYRDHCVLAGRFQDINAEINIEACHEHGFQFGRRLTGGGAIIMGSGQLGICLATDSRAFKWENIRELYHLFSAPIIDALSQMGIYARFRAKNDLEVAGKKIAGLGVHVGADGSIQFHTSLLIDLDVEQMLKVLKIPIQKYDDRKKITSIEKRITTISKELGKRVSIAEVTAVVKQAFADAFAIQFTEKPFSLAETERIKSLEKERYAADDWIFQNSPQADMTGMSLKKTPAGLLRTYIGLKGETIKSVLITGDFFEQATVFSQIETALKWSSMDKENIAGVVNKVLTENNAQGNSFGLAPVVIADAIWLAAQRAMAAERYTYKGSCYYPKKETKERELTADKV
jgi:lipoate-protein ligase A